MNFVIKALSTAAILAFSVEATAGDTLRERMLRKYAVSNGLVRPEETWIEFNPELANVGKRLFESKLLSSNNDTACASCHLDRFGSADGLPTAIGVEGRSFGMERVEFGGDPLPRNALPLWGRGGKGFDTLFWDGRVQKLADGHVTSQFGDNAPSEDALTVAAHLPPLQLGEMVFDRDGQFAEYEQETVDAALAYADTVLDRLRTGSDLLEAVGSALGKPEQSVTFTDVMGTVAHFIAFNFRLRTTRFHAFVFEGGSLTAAELRGGVLFYGKAQCTACHNGPYFSDLSFHAIAFPQLGFGANGFGEDYGRYNVTQNPKDIYLFRTPPLFNVSKTAPYSHSGSIFDLNDAIRFHDDPLGFFDAANTDPETRHRYARLIGTWSRDYPVNARLSDQDIDDLVAFLQTLDYESESPVEELD